MLELVRHGQGISGVLLKRTAVLMVSQVRLAYPEDVAKVTRKQILGFDAVSMVSDMLVRWRSEAHT